MMVDIERRTLLSHLAMLLGVTSLPADAFAAPKGPAKKRFLAPAQFQLLTALADTIIPATDTPGAIAAGVPSKLDRMLLNWASAETRAKIISAITSLNAAALAQKKKGFAALTAAERKAVLTGHDAAALKSVPPPPNAPKLIFFTQQSYVVDPGYLALKGLVINLYYSSQIGMTKELIYEHNPGKFQPSIKTTAATRPWASGGPF